MALGEGLGRLFDIEPAISQKSGTIDGISPRDARRRSEPDAVLRSDPCRIGYSRGTVPVPGGPLVAAPSSSCDSPALWMRIALATSPP